MKRMRFIAALSISMLALTAGAVIAAPKVINITKKLGGVAGNVFTLDGQLRVRSLFVRDSLDAKYDNTISGLKAKTYKGAIDELGISVSKLIGGTSLKVSSTALVKTTSVDTTTWKGNGYVYTIDPLTNGLVRKTQDITVTFTPTSGTTGTFTSTPLYVFSVAGSHLAYVKNGVTTSDCGTPLSGYSFANGNYPSGTYSGKYQLVGDFKIWTFPTASSNADCIVPPVSWTNSYSHPSDISTKGTKMTITNDDSTQIILERQ